MGWAAHTVVDAALAVGLLIAGIHGNGDNYLVLDAAGGYLALITLLTNGPVGVFRLVPRLVHRVADGAVALGLFASPFIAWKYHVHIDPFATAMAEAVGVILLRDAVVSEHRVVPRLRSKVTEPIDTRAFEVGVHDAARRAGALTGKAATKAASARGRWRAPKA